MDADPRSVFAKQPETIPLYEALESRILTELPHTNIRVAKTQVTFANRYGFAFASLPVRRMKGWPEEMILVTFGLEREEKHPRIAVATEPYPNRWTHHVVVSRVDEIDDELMEWIREAEAFAAIK